MKVHPVVHFLFKNTTRLFLLLVFVGIPAAALYLRKEGIGFGAREALAQALSNDAVHVEIERLALDPFSGLLAKEILITEKTGRKRLLAKVSNVALSLNFSQLAEGRVVVDRLVLEDAGVSIPVDASTDAQRVDITEVRAEVILLGDQLRLSRFNGVIEGVRVELTGQFLNPNSLQLSPSAQASTSAAPSPTPSSPATATPSPAGKFLASLAKVRFPDGPPTIHADLEADLANLDSLKVQNLRIRAGRIVGPGWELRSADAHGFYVQGKLLIPRLTLNDATGTLELSAEWTRTDGQLDAGVISTLQPTPFLHAIADKKSALRALKFTAPPQFEARIQADLSGPKPSFRVTGSVFAPEIRFKDVAFREAGMAFAHKDGIFYARDLQVSVGQGRLAGNVWVAPNDFRISVKNTISPTDLLGLFDPKVRETLDTMEFKDPPQISLDITASKLDFANIRGTGHIKLGRSAMRKAWFDSVESDLTIGDRCVTCKNMVVTRNGGRGTGDFDYDVGNLECRLGTIQSTLIPYDVLMWIDPKVAQAITPYRFHAPPTVTVKGKVHLKDPTKNNLTIAIESAAGLDYDLLKRTLNFGKTSANVRVAGSTVLADIRRAALMGGDANIKARVSIDPRNPTFGMDIKLTRVNFSKLTDLFFKYNDSKGLMSGNYKFEARTGKEELMVGSGSIRIEDGNVFAIPILGPFSYIIGEIIPVVGYQNARLATADFTVAHEKINSTNLVIEGLGFSMYGNGDIHFMTGKLDMGIRLNARGIPGIVFYPVSKFFEYVSTGTISEPAWRPKIIRQIPFIGGGNGAKTPPPEKSQNRR